MFRRTTWYSYPSRYKKSWVEYVNRRVWKENGFKNAETTAVTNPVEPNQKVTEIEQPTETKQPIELTKQEVEEINKQYKWTKIIHNWFPYDSPVQDMVQYAYDIWGFDLVKLIECENGMRDPFRQSGVISNWKREPSYWLCQIHKNHHPEVINDANFWNDWKVQIDYCKKGQDEWRPFYWPTRIVKGKKCYIAVEDRFTFTE